MAEFKVEFIHEFFFVIHYFTNIIFFESCRPGADKSELYITTIVISKKNIIFLLHITVNQLKKQAFSAIYCHVFCNRLHTYFHQIDSGLHFPNSRLAKKICNRLHLFKNFLYSLSELLIRCLDLSNQS